jgi:diacylglycerol kinase (ATP)
MKYAFILNPAANSDKNRGRVNRLEASILRSFPDALIVHSERKGDITEKARSLANDHDIVVVCGGDGSVNELMMGLRGTNCIGGVIPSGSGNDFSRGLGISTDIELEIATLTERRVVGMDSVDVQIDGQPSMFQNTLGIGFDGWANLFASRISFPKGKLKYVAAALRSVMHHRKQTFNLVIDGESECCDALMITLANGGIEGGGFYVAPNARPDDGYLDVVIVKPIGKIGLILRLPFLLLKSQPQFRALERKRCRQIDISCADGMVAHADGENLGQDIKTIRASLIHNGASFLVPMKSR